MSLGTPEKIRRLQRKLYAKAKHELFRARLPGQWVDGNQADALRARCSRRTAAGERCPWRSMSQRSL